MGLVSEEKFRISSLCPAQQSDHNGTMSSSILLVEDEPLIASSLVSAMQAEGYSVTHAPSCASALRYLVHATSQLLVLDWMLPDGDGLQVLERARTKDEHVRAIILTARSEIAERVHALRSGADDYLVKPFAYAELSARMAALLRRGTASSDSLSYAHLRLQLLSRQAFLNEQLLDLTQREFDLLAYLVRHAERSVSRSMLARDVWKQTQRATALDNVIDVHIARLRRKLESIAPNRLIHTQRGIGFCMSVNEPL
jgi:two-component system, OmpR family, copper resistance phosphate regulon response regulator CusR